MAFKKLTELSNSRHFIDMVPKTSKWAGIELTVANENIERQTVWAIKEKRHTLIVHLGGTINQIETEIDRRTAKLNPPTAGEFWLIPANAEYFTFTQGETVNYAEFYFEPDYLESVLGKNAGNYELKPHVGIFDNFLYQNAKQLSLLMSKSDDISILMGENISQTLCLHLFNNYSANNLPSEERSVKFTPKKFSKLQEYIYDNLGEKITLEKLSRVAEVAPHNLLRGFTKSFGKTPGQYIIEQRLRKVRWLLVNTKKDITTIALETGFSSHSHLTTTFKVQIGITPKEFRNSQK